MIALNLSETKNEYKILKGYLESVVSEILAEKINAGVRIEKDGKTLINKKTLETFLVYAGSEAQKLAEKGARCACIDDMTVFGWAIHYFEEDSIEGTLYNEDGTPYKPNNKPVAQISAPPKPPAIKPPKNCSTQMAFDFDLPSGEVKLPDDAANEVEEQDLAVNDDGQDETAEAVQLPDGEYMDDDGEIHQVAVTPNVTASKARKTVPNALTKLFGETLFAR